MHNCLHSPKRALGMRLAQKTPAASPHTTFPPPAMLQTRPLGRSRLKARFPIGWSSPRSTPRPSEKETVQKQTAAVTVCWMHVKKVGRPASILDMLHKNKRCWLTVRVLVFRKQAPIYFFSFFANLYSQTVNTFPQCHLNEKKPQLGFNLPGPVHNTGITPFS